VSLVLALVAAYLLGSVPAGYMVGRAKGIDLRAVGSGNIGASNVVRSIGKPWGIAVFLFDFAKGLVSALVGAWLVASGHVSGVSADAAALMLGGAAFLGHVFPVFLGFKGGKGVATAAGLCCGVAPLALAVAFGVWLVAFKWPRIVSIGSLCGALAFPVSFVLIEGPERALGERGLVTGVAVLLAAVIIFLHRSNIGRLVRGEELRMGGSDFKGRKNS